jgi:hypothetical protein
MTTKRKLSDTYVGRLAPPAKGRELHYDSQVPGLPVSITEKGSRTFVLFRRFGGASPTRAMLRHDDGRPPASVAEARAIARAWLDQIAAGIDPRREAERRRQEEKKRNAATFGALAER